MTTLEQSWHALLSQLPTCGLVALRDALACDSPELAQKCTVRPCPVGAAGDFPPEAACALGYAAWKAWRLGTARAVDREYGGVFFRAQEASGDRDGCIAALNFFDESPRAEAFKLVLRVAVAVLAEREAEARAEVA